MAEVKRFQVKGATIIIDDACVLHSDEDTEKILKECARIARDALYAKEMRKRNAEAG